MSGVDKKYPGLFYDKGGMVFNVKHPDFGAKGDGTTDDYTAIQSALNYAGASGRGGIVYLPSGEYKINTGLVMQGLSLENMRVGPCVTLMGDHQNTSFLKAGSSNITLIDHAGPSSVKSLGLNGDGLSNVIGIDMNSNARISDLYIYGCSVGLDYVGNSLTSVGVFYSKVDGLFIDSCGIGIRKQTTGGGVNWVNSNQVFNAQIRGCTSQAVLIDGADGNSFHALDIETNAQGLRILNGQGTRVYGNWFEKNPNPITNGLYNLHIAYTFKTAGSIIQANGLLSFCAQINTTGSITSGTPTLTVASATNFERGKVILVTGAGAAGADLYSEVIGVSGTTITLADNAGTTVAGVVVRGPKFLSTCPTEIRTEQYGYQFGTAIIQDLLTFNFKPDIAGSKGGNVALGNIIDTLEARGTWTDSTT